ncbi:MAG: porin family protein [Bacteroidota bacterium]|nr:porin family protein [Bacteroidota bacterium]
MHKLTKYILPALLFILVSGTVCRAEGNLPYVDQKLIHFGFSLGINAMDFGVTPRDSARVSTLKPGFSVGIISDLRLNRYLNLRFTPTLHFGERELLYPFKTGNYSSNSVKISSIPICLPIYLKYSAERTGNYRPYLIFGGGVSYDLGTNSSSENPVLLKPIDFYTEFGVGCDIYFSFFKLAPELKYSIGYNDMFTPANKRGSSISNNQERFSTALSRLTSRMLTLTFNFE